MLFEIKNYLTSSLNRLDKMNMAAGLEATTPFLDNELFDYALSIPKNKKLKLFSNKYILRKLAIQYLPPENLKMPKSGFGVPIAKWFQTDVLLKRTLEEVKNDRLMNEIFNKHVLRELMHKHLNDQYDYSEILWLILNFYLWHKQFFR